MYSEKPRPIDFYKEGSGGDMMIEVVSNGELPPHHHHHQQHQQSMILGDSSGEDHDINKAPKKRAETWVQDEIRCLIALRREMDGLFNTSKSNKHLWEQISTKMRERGFDRSASMCTDKWRNLLKEFKKLKHHDRGNGLAKMLCYQEIEEILRERNKNAQYKSTAAVSKVDSYIQFSDKGIEDTSIPFGPLEASGRSTINLERQLDHDGHSLAITAADAVVAASGVPPWNWRETPNGGESQTYNGRVITVKCGDYTRRIGIDGSGEAIKEAIKSVFGLRTRRAFWLEDEDGIVRSFDRDMPLGDYILRLDEGIMIKVCHYDESDHISVHTEDKSFYTEDDFHNFLTRRGWTCLRELNGYGNVYFLDELRSGAVYRGMS